MLRALSVVLLIMSGAPVSATVRICDDLGGQIGVYLAKYQALRRSGERVVVDGTCASACTMILGAIPENRLCVTPRAVFEFHAAWDFTPPGGHAVSTAGNQILWSNYPSAIRKWITRHGGLRLQIIYLYGPELNAMYPACD